VLALSIALSVAQPGGVSPETLLPTFKLPADDSPAWSLAPLGESLHLDHAHQASIGHAINHACKDGDGKYAMSCIQISATGCVVGTDGRRLYVSPPIFPGSDILVPSQTLKQALAIHNAGGSKRAPRTLALRAPPLALRVTMRSTGRETTLRTVDSAFPPYVRVIPKLEECVAGATLPPLDWLRAASKMSDSPCVVCSINPDGVTVWSMQKTAFPPCYVRSSPHHARSAGAVRVGLNPAFLLDAIASTGAAHFRAAHPKAPVILQGSDDSTAVVMAINLD